MKHIFNSTIKDLKKELQYRNLEESNDLLIKIAKISIQNKEFLHYQLFESQDKQAYFNKLKNVVENFEFKGHASLYHCYKSFKKCVRQVLKQIKYAENKELEAELAVFMVVFMNDNKSKWKNSSYFIRLYASLNKKATQCLKNLHEDLQFDLKNQLDKLVKIV